MQHPEDRFILVVVSMDLETKDSKRMYEKGELLK